MTTVGERAGLVTAAGQVGTEPDGSRDWGRKRSGMEVPRVFSSEGQSPFDQVEWDLRTAEIKDEQGRVIFQQVDCEIPRGWSQLAANVVASKYFYGDMASGNGSPGQGKREEPDRGLVGVGIIARISLHQCQIGYVGGSFPNDPTYNFD